MHDTDLMSSAAVIRRIKADLENSANRIEGSFAADNAQAVGKEIAKYYAYTNWLHEMHYVDTAAGEFLDRKAAEVGIYRKMGVWARGFVTFYGTAGTEIPFDFPVRSETQRYRTLETGVIDESGSITLPVEAEQGGVVGNVPANVINAFDSLVGLNRVANADAITGGTEREMDAGLRERTLLRMRYPGTSGNQYHYLHWAMEVEGVGRVKVFPLWDGPGTVKVSILDGNQRLASEELISKVRDHIDPEPRMGEGLAPIGAYLTVSTATGVSVNVTAEIVLLPDATETKEAIQQAFSADLQAYFDEIAYTEHRHITVAKLIDLLWSVEGVGNILSLSINDAANNILLEDEEIATVGTVTVT